MSGFYSLIYKWWVYSISSLYFNPDEKELPQQWRPGLALPVSVEGIPRTEQYIIFRISFVWCFEQLWPRSMFLLASVVVTTCELGQVDRSMSTTSCLLCHCWSDMSYVLKVRYVQHCWLAVSCILICVTVNELCPVYWYVSLLTSCVLCIDLCDCDELCPV
jgi:hypothetical protein